MTSPLATLRAARELISVPERWTQDVPARGKSGKEVSPISKHAVCWCMVGATLKVNRGRRHEAALDELKADAGQWFIGDLNDESTHAEVLALFDRTIARLSREAGR